MTHINKVIEESLSKLDEVFPYIALPYPLEGYDVNKLKSHLRTTISNLLDAVGVEVEGNKNNPPVFLCQDGVSYDWMQKDAYILGLSDIQVIIKSAKEKIQ